MAPESRSPWAQEGHRSALGEADLTTADRFLEEARDNGGVECRGIEKLLRLFGHCRPLSGLLGRRSTLAWAGSGSNEMRRRGKEIVPLRIGFSVN
jgi:hypothetical protein